jgi:ComF family protein
MGILDLVYPKKCVACKKIGSYLCDDCFSYLSFETKSICLVCNRPSFDGLTHPGCKKPFLIDGLFSSIPYNKTAQKLIYNFKYKPYLTDLKKVLSNLFYEGLIQNEYFMREIQLRKVRPCEASEWIVVPIPLHSSKIKKRGYNQSEILSQELAKRFNLPIKNLLTRVKNTKAQFGLNKSERKQNIEKAFMLNSKYDPPAYGLKIFLVDDVATTGSTLCEAANVLKRNSVKRVIGLTLARD